MKTTTAQFRFLRMLNMATTLAHVRAAGWFAVRHLPEGTREELRQTWQAALLRVQPATAEAPEPRLDVHPFIEKVQAGVSVRELRKAFAALSKVDRERFQHLIEEEAA